MNKLKRIDNFNFRCIEKNKCIGCEKIFLIFKIVRNIIIEERNEFLQTKNKN